MGGEGAARGSAAAEGAGRKEAPDSKVVAAAVKGSFELGPDSHSVILLFA